MCSKSNPFAETLLYTDFISVFPDTLAISNGLLIKNGFPSQVKLI
jgi:hypothetical protein